MSERGGERGRQARISPQSSSRRTDNPAGRAGATVANQQTDGDETDSERGRETGKDQDRKRWREREKAQRK